MQRYGLIGWPVAHSLSPPMQNAAFEACGLDAHYETLETTPETVLDTVDNMLADGFSGWNATVPHKAAMAVRADTIDDVAKAAQSVNTVVVRKGRLHGASTDGYGLEQALRDAFGLSVPGACIAFLGAGGAARACALHFAERGVGALLILNRTPERAQALLADVQRFRPAVPGHAAALDDKRADDLLTQCDAVVQATSLGLHPDDPPPFPLERLPPGIPVMDMIYRDTPFLAGAARCGHPTADGQAMLVHQGARSFELWTGHTPPVEVMRNALTVAVRTRSSQSDS